MIESLRSVIAKTTGGRFWQTAALCGAVCGLDSGVFATVIQSLSLLPTCTDLRLSLFAGVTMLGVLMASLVGGRLSDSWGRRRVIGLGLAVNFVGSLPLVLGTGSWPLLYASRVLQSLGLGLLYVAVPVYLSEMTPEAVRGRRVGAFQLMLVVTMLLGAVLGMCVRSHTWCFAVPTVLAAVLLPLGWLLPESVRRTAVEVADARLFTGANVRPLFVATLVAVLIPLSGIGVVMDCSVTVFDRAGLGFLGTHVIDLALKATNVALTLPALLLADRFGRRPLYVCGTAGMTAGLVLAVCAFALGDAWHILAAVGVLLYIAAFAVGPGVCSWLVMTEALPLPVRARGMSFALTAKTLVSFAVASAFFPLVGAVGPASAYGLLACFSAAYLLFALLALK